MPAYTRPLYTAANFDLQQYSRPLYNAVDFDLDAWAPGANQPTDLSAAILAGPKVRLSWSEGGPEQEGDGFKIYRSANGGEFSLQDTVSLDTLEWDDETISRGNRYTYTVYEYKDVTLSTGASCSAFLPVEDESVTLSDLASRSSARVLPCEVEIDGARRVGVARPFPLEWVDLLDGDRRDILRPLDPQGIGIARARSRLWDIVRLHPEGAAVSHAILHGVHRPFPLSMGFTDGVVRGLARELSEEFDLVSTMGRVWELGRELTATVTAEDTLTRRIEREEHESIPFLEGWNQEMRRMVVAALAIEDIMSRIVLWERGFPEDIDVFDGDRRDAARSVSEALSVLSLEHREALRELIASVLMEGETYRDFSRDLSEALSISERFGRLWDLQRAWSEAAGLSAVASRTWGMGRTAFGTFRVFGRLTAPPGSTGYPWDVPPFVTRLERKRLTRGTALWILDRLLAARRLSRESELEVLDRELRSEILKRETTMSNRGGEA